MTSSFTVFSMMRELIIVYSLSSVYDERTKYMKMGGDENVVITFTVGSLYLGYC